MPLSDADRLLVTGATGLVGSHVCQEAARRGVKVRALVRTGSDVSALESLEGIEFAYGDMTDHASLEKAAAGATACVHCAAKVGDWGPTSDYRTLNVDGTDKLVPVLQNEDGFRRFVHVSSLGVYPARDHHGTDETEQPSTQGIDGYTLTKVEAEQRVLDYISHSNFPAVVLRPGFIYGPRDRTVLPRIFEKLASGEFKFLGTGEKKMNNTFVGNLVHAIFLALDPDREDIVGEVYNIRDPHLVSKTEFIRVIAEEAGLPMPTGHVPLPVAKGLAKVLEGTWKLLGKTEPPILSSARIKFLGLNLDYGIDKAKTELGYAPETEYQTGMQQTVGWFKDQGLLPKAG